MLAAIFSFLVAAAGWYYMLHSRAGTVLVGLEDEHLNRRRMRLRRINGALMVLLGACCYTFYRLADREYFGRWFYLLTLVVLVLLVIIIVLAILDLRLTFRLRHGRPEE